MNRLCSALLVLFLSISIIGQTRGHAWNWDSNESNSSSTSIPKSLEQHSGEEIHSQEISSTPSQSVEVHSKEEPISSAPPPASEEKTSLPNSAKGVLEKLGEAVESVEEVLTGEDFGGVADESHDGNHPVDSKADDKAGSFRSSQEYNKKGREGYNSPYEKVNLTPWVLLLTTVVVVSGVLIFRRIHRRRHLRRFGSVEYSTSPSYLSGDENVLL